MQISAHIESKKYRDKSDVFRDLFFILSHVLKFDSTVRCAIQVWEYSDKILNLGFKLLLSPDSQQ